MCGVCLGGVWGGVRFLFSEPLSILISCCSISEDLSHGFRDGASAWETTSAVEVKTEERSEAPALNAATRAAGEGGEKVLKEKAHVPLPLPRIEGEPPPITLNAEPASGELGGGPPQS